ncbi:hypothetical protein D6789_01080 [Candidatus Woesearchaeota archaeon]|nr:MAG: hypothetical protein D6789_01080 [Candidatus Woesearchaeota archaeon]
MRSKTIVVVTFMFVIGILFASLAFAGPTGGSTTTGAQDRGVNSSVTTLTTEGGNVTEVNVTGTQITTKWAGFYGQVSGSLQITDASSNVFYSWSVANVSGSVVYATNGTVNDWSNANINAMNYSNAPTHIGNVSATDNFTNTFNFSGTFSSASITQATAYTETYVSGSQTHDFKTYALVSSSDKVAIWAAVARDDDTSFQGGLNTVDYQLLAGTLDGTNTQFSFYLELP